MHKSGKESKNGDSFEGVYTYIRKLEHKNKTLSKDNAVLAEKLSAKRYRMIDFLVDSTYAIFRSPNKKKALIERNIDVSINKMPPLELPERKTEEGRVDIINVNFYDWDGKILFKGGAERYVYDLACLLKGMGYYPRLLQCSKKAFKKTYRGIEVIGIGEGNINDMRENSFLFNRYCRNAELIIASPLELACEIKDIPTIGINHGINFDGDWNHYNKNGYMPNYDTYMDALKNVQKCVCVDTNFINWTRTIDYKNTLKEIYIPNYYDAMQFKNLKRVNNDGKVVFVYPRRIYNARGADITIKVFDKVLKKRGDKIIVKFVGQIDNEKIGKRLHSLMEKYPKNVFHLEYEMNEMHKAYEDADVVLVPTRYCEGTSLSCIEGMISGAAIITTNVGGLPNLVIDEYNGRLISPTADDLEEAVIDLADDAEKRARLAKNGQEVAKNAFCKEMWDRKWQNVFRKVLKA